jgi:hypothetical protein
MSDFSLSSWRDHCSPHLESLIISDRELKKSMESVDLNEGRIQEINNLIFNDALLPPGDYTKDEDFRHVMTLDALLYTEGSNFPDEKFDMKALQKYFLSNEIPNLIQKVCKDLDGSRKLTLIQIAKFIGKEREQVSCLYRFSQLMRHSSDQIAYVKVLNEKGLHYHRFEGELSALGWVALEETTPERVLFNLWFSELFNTDKAANHWNRTCDLWNKSISKKIRAAISAMEEFTLSADKEIARQAKCFLHRVCFEDLRYKADLQMKKLKSMLDELFAIPSFANLEIFAPAAPLFVLLANAVNHRARMQRKTPAYEAKWIGDFTVPYLLSHRVNWISAQRFYVIIAHAVSTGYFTRQQQTIAYLEDEYKKLTKGPITSFDQYKLPSQEDSVAKAESSQTAAKSSPVFEHKKKKKKKDDSALAQEKTETITLEVERGSSSSNLAKSENDVEKTPEIKEPFSLLSLQQRFEQLWDSNLLTYAQRVQRWIRVAKGDQIDKVREFTDKGKQNYGNIASNEALRAILVQHHFPPIERIYGDEDWKRRFAFRTERGFGIICFLKTPGGAVFKGTVYIGFALEDPKKVIHRFFVLANKDNKTFESFIQAVNNKKEEEDLFYQDQGPNQLLYGNVLCEITGKGKNEVITMKTDGVEISAIPHGLE